MDCYFCLYVAMVARIPFRYRRAEIRGKVIEVFRTSRAAMRTRSRWRLPAGGRAQAIAGQAVASFQQFELGPGGGRAASRLLRTGLPHLHEVPPGTTRLAHVSGNASEGFQGAIAW